MLGSRKNYQIQTIEDCDLDPSSSRERSAGNAVQHVTELEPRQLHFEGQESTDNVQYNTIILAV
jgi:hypothetical protein